MLSCLPVVTRPCSADSPLLGDARCCSLFPNTPVLVTVLPPLSLLPPSGSPLSGSPPSSLCESLPLVPSPPSPLSGSSNSLPCVSLSSLCTRVSLSPSSLYLSSLPLFLWYVYASVWFPIPGSVPLSLCACYCFLSGQSSPPPMLTCSSVVRVRLYVYTSSLVYV